MVFIVKLKWISFKMDLSDIDSLLSNQKGTYAILRYSQDIPSSVYASVMCSLLECIDFISERKLVNLLDEYSKATKVGFSDWEEEIVDTYSYIPELGVTLQGNYAWEGNMLINLDTGEREERSSQYGSLEIEDYELDEEY